MSTEDSSGRAPVSFLGADLSRWDLLTGAPGGPPDSLVLPFFEDERPLRGASGLVDWRLCGRLSRLILAGRISGAVEESTLLPGMRLPFSKLLLQGLGRSSGFDEPRFRAAVADLRGVLLKMDVRRYALSLPGRSTGRIMARRALELWLEDADRESEVWLIEPPAALKEMSEALGERGG